MFDQAQFPSRDPSEVSPTDLARALTHTVLEAFGDLGQDLEPLLELYGLLRKIHKKERALQQEGPITDPPLVQLESDQAIKKVFQLQDQLDLPLRARTRSESGRAHPRTPAELCRALMELTVELDEEVLIQNDASRSPDERKIAIDSVAYKHALRSHLQQCLQQLMQDIRDGCATLPPHQEIRRHENPYVNPVTQKEVSIDIYAIAQKATDRKKEVQHILGIACNGHGASLSYLGRDGTVRSSVFDRWAGTKYTLLMSRSERDEILGRTSPITEEMYDLLFYSYGQFPKHHVFEESFPGWLHWLLAGLDVRAEDIDLLISSESNFVTSLFRLAPKLNQWLPNAQVITDVEHHTVHQCQAFWQSGFQEAAVLTLDTCGENLTRLNDYKICGTVASMDRSGRCDVLREFIFPHASAGLIYSIVNHHLGFSQGQEGKTMGLAPYGRPDLYRDLVKTLRLYADGSFDFLNYKELQNALGDYEPERKIARGGALTKRHEDIAYAGQALVEDIVTNAFKAALHLTGLDNLVYSGGLGLNSVANEIANRAARPRRLYIPPNPSDTGQALGCALYAAQKLAGWTPRMDEMPEYLGPEYDPDEILKAVQSSKHAKVQAQPEHLTDTAARCIANGHIVARFSGRAEFGPRALGNRSILADPRRKDMKDYLNSRVKHREGYRPFAPSVLLEHVHRWFDLNDRSPYMLRVVDVPPAVRDLIPAIVHVDGSARVQTVDPEENPGYGALISAFHKMTDVPLVLNTSFNVAGKPIVETPQDAVDCFESTNIDVLLLEDWILSKRPLEEFERNSR